MRWLLLLLFAAAPAWADEANYVQVMRGRALVTAGDRTACHIAANGTPFARRRGISTPFGVINSATSRRTMPPASGPGAPTSSTVPCTRTAVPAGPNLYAAFSYTAYTRVSRSDSDTIFAYLRTLPPATNAVDRDTLPFPFNIRTSMAAWNSLFFNPGQFQPDPQHSEEYNRGAYLVDGLGHCGACHTPMSALGANADSQYLQGNQIQNWVAPNITNDQRTGLGSWSAGDIVEYLRTGRNARSAASGPIAEVVQYSAAFMPDADLHAIAVYMKERATADPAAPPPVAATDAQMREGESIYATPAWPAPPAPAWASSACSPAWPAVRWCSSLTRPPWRASC